MLPVLAYADRGSPVRYNRRPVTAQARQAGTETADTAAIDIALMTRITARDAHAIGELYDRHHRLLFGLVFRVLGSRSDAEDVLQDVFMAVWNRAESYNAGLGSPVAWLVRVARNRAVDRLRANGVRTRTLEVISTVPDISETPEDRAAAHESARRITQALAALPTDLRRLIEEAYFLGLTHSELAERHTLPLGTVKTRIRTGMLALRHSLTQDRP